MFSNKQLKRFAAFFVIPLMFLFVLSPYGVIPVNAATVQDPQPQLITPAISDQWGNQLALASNGTVWSWGNQYPNPFTQQTPSLTGIQSISAGTGFSFALKNNGTVWGWGSNLEGQLGNGKTDSNPVTVPVQVQGLMDTIQVSAGHDHSLALERDGTVWAWGRNDSGQLGEGTTSSQLIPVQVKNLENVKFISAGEYLSLAVKQDGTVWAWGNNYYGTLGDGTHISKPLPVQVQGLTGIMQVSTGEYYSMALKEDGTVWAWGRNDKGELGNSTTIDQNAPVLVQGLTDVTQIVAGIGTSLALKKDGTVWAWGDGSFGVLGIAANRTNSSHPIPVNGAVDAIAIAGGSMNAYLLKKDDTLWGWGTNGMNEISKDSTVNFPTPSQVTLNLNPSPPKVISTSVPDQGKLVIPKSEILLTFSESIDPAHVSNPENVSLVDEQNNSVPTQVAVEAYQDPLKIAITPQNLIPGMKYTLTLKLTDIAGFTMTEPSVIHFMATLPLTSEEPVLSAGALHSLYITPSNLLAWGENSSGQLGDGTTISRSTPVPVKGLTNVVNVAAGGYHSLALLRDGTVMAWGNNHFGQIGNGSTTNTNIPVQVSGLIDSVALSAGDRHSLALRDDGTVWAWGENQSGQLGDGTNVDQKSPVQVQGLTHIIAIAAGGQHSLALRYDGTVWAWGKNDVGQLGNGINIDSNQPVQVQNLEDIQSISAGWAHSLALKSDGTVFSWGDNEYGQLGDGGKEVDLNLPVQIPNLSGIQSIEAGDDTSFAISKNNISNGNVWAWGSNALNELGDYSTKRVQTSPEAIDASAFTVTSGGGHTLIYGNAFGHNKAFGDTGVWSWGLNTSGQIGDGLTEHAFEPVKALVDGDPVFYRLAGKDRIETALQTSSEGWNYGAPTVILARDDDFPDALAGAPLAHAVGGPILLTNSKVLSPETSDMINQLHPKEVLILGSSGAISDSIEGGLKANFQVTRLGGKDRYETAAKIALYMKEHQLLSTQKAVVAYGENFPDALSVSSLAAYQDIPILLSDSQNLPGSTQDALNQMGITQTIVVGGNGVISEGVAAKLPGMTRLAGTDRYETSMAIAKGMGADNQTIFVATGENFPDALAASALAAKTNSPIILVNAGLPSAASSYLQNYRGKVKDIFLMGGAAVVSDDILNKVYQAIHSL